MSKHSSCVLCAIEYCIAMSQDHHLSVHIDTTRQNRLPEDHIGSMSDPLHNVKPIAAATRCWSTVTIELAQATELQILLSWMSDFPDKLHKLSILVMSGAHLGSREIVYLPIFINSPMAHVELENLSLHNISLSPCHLTDLRCDIMEPQQLCEVLKAFGRLMHLTIHPATGRGGRIRYLWTFDRNYIVHQQLIAFLVFVSLFHTLDLPQVPVSLDTICLPQLRALALRGPGYFSEAMTTPLFVSDEMQ